MAPDISFNEPLFHASNGISKKKRSDFKEYVATRRHLSLC